MSSTKGAWRAKLIGHPPPLHRRTEQVRPTAPTAQAWAGGQSGSWHWANTALVAHCRLPPHLVPLPLQAITGSEHLAVDQTGMVTLPLTKPVGVPA